MSSGLKQRVTTAIIIGIPILCLVFYSDFTRLIFLGLVGILSSLEFLKLCYKSPLHRVEAILSFILSCTIFYFSIVSSSMVFQYLLIIGLISLSLLIYNLFSGKPSLLLRTPWLWNILYIVIPISTLMAMHEYRSEQFSAIVISTLLLIWISDSGAYFVGKSTGKRKLMPSVSPGKTWEGFWGAGLLSLLFSYVFFSVFNHYPVQIWAMIAISIWLFGSVGDLIESKFKRQLNIKDSGSIMPGHGGFLDRFDGFIFCLPFVLFIIFLFN